MKRDFRLPRSMLPQHRGIHSHISILIYVVALPVSTYISHPLHLRVAAPPGARDKANSSHTTVSCYPVQWVFTKAYFIYSPLRTHIIDIHIRCTNCIVQCVFTKAYVIYGTLRTHIIDIHIRCTDCIDVNRQSTPTYQSS